MNSLPHYLSSGQPVERQGCCVQRKQGTYSHIHVLPKRARPLVGSLRLSHRWILELARICLHWHGPYIHWEEIVLGINARALDI